MNLAALIDIPALIAPDAPALDGSAAVDYARLRVAVGRGAGLLGGLGVSAGDRVGVLATNSIEHIEALFAVAAVGGVAVPMNYRAKRREIEHLLADSGAKVLLTESRYTELVEDARPPSVDEVILLDSDADDGWRRRVGAAEEMVEIAEVADDDVCMLLYTSGTTSLPKGVMLTHGAMTSYVMDRSDPADGDDHGRLLLAAPLYHIAGVTSLLSALYSGRTVVVAPQFDAGEWLETVEQHRITHSFLVPTMLAQIIDHPDVARRDLSSLEVVTYGAAPMPPAVIRRAIELFPDTAGFSQAYGQTETNSTVTVLTPDDHRLDGDPDEVARKVRRLSSVGRAVDDVELRIVDADGTVLGPGEHGEVHLRSARQMTGYWGEGSNRTADTLGDDQWIRSGDLGYLDEDGYLFLGGRAGDLIIRGGENIAAEEVEAVLYEHPDVAEAGVVGVEDDEWGERVLAAVVRRPGSTIGEASLADFCRESLATFKRPDHFVFVDKLPRTSTGKLLRRELRQLGTG